MGLPFTRMNHRADLFLFIKLLLCWVEKLCFHFTSLPFHFSLLGQVSSNTACFLSQTEHLKHGIVQKNTRKTLDNYKIPREPEGQDFVMLSSSHVSVYPP